MSQNEAEEYVSVVLFFISSYIPFGIFMIFCSAENKLWQFVLSYANRCHVENYKCICRHKALPSHIISTIYDFKSLGRFSSDNSKKRRVMTVLFFQLILIMFDSMISYYVLIIPAKFQSNSTSYCCIILCLHVNNSHFEISQAECTAPHDNDHGGQL